MVKSTNQQRLEIIENYYRNSESVVATLRALTPIFGRNNRPTRQAVRAIVDKFDTNFTLLDVPVPKRHHIARSEEIIAAISASIQNEPNQSIPRRSQELGIAQTTLWRIMRKYLGLHAFKIKLTQELKPLDHLKRRSSPIGLWQSLKKMKNFIKKSSSAIKLISGSMAFLISKICVIGQQQTQMCFLRHRCIRKK